MLVTSELVARVQDVRACWNAEDPVTGEALESGAAVGLSCMYANEQGVIEERIYGVSSATFDAMLGSPHISWAGVLPRPPTPAEVAAYNTTTRHTVADVVFVYDANRARNRITAIVRGHAGTKFAVFRAALEKKFPTLANRRYFQSATCQFEPNAAVRGGTTLVRVV